MWENWIYAHDLISNRRVFALVCLKNWLVLQCSLMFHLSLLLFFSLRWMYRCAGPLSLMGWGYVWVVLYFGLASVHPRTSPQYVIKLCRCCWLGDKSVSLLTGGFKYPTHRQFGSSYHIIIGNMLTVLLTAAILKTIRLKIKKYTTMFSLIPSANW